MERTHYDVLGLTPNATSEEIAAAYRQLARQFHPDVNPEDPHAATKFKEVQKAFEELSDPSRRGRYDQRLRSQAEEKQRHKQRQQRAESKRRRREQEQQAEESRRRASGAEPRSTNKHPHPNPADTDRVGEAKAARNAQAAAAKKRWEEYKKRTTHTSGKEERHTATHSASSATPQAASWESLDSPEWASPTRPLFEPAMSPLGNILLAFAIAVGMTVCGDSVSDAAISALQALAQKVGLAVTLSPWAGHGLAAATYGLICYLIYRATANP
jgi:curved DNA-binding protein CbpA